MMTARETLLIYTGGACRTYMELVEGSVAAHLSCRMSWKTRTDDGKKLLELWYEYAKEVSHESTFFGGRGLPEVICFGSPSWPIGRE